MKREPWVSLEEIAQHLAVSQDTVHRWIRNREMPAHKVGRVWRFQISEIDQWVRTGRTGSGHGGRDDQSGDAGNAADG